MLRRHIRGTSPATTRRADDRRMMVQSRIRELQGMAQELKRTIESCVGQSCGECAILGALQRPDSSQSQATQPLNCRV